MLDRSAEEILPSLGLTYSRYLTLLTIERLGQATQRAIADAVGLSRLLIREPLEHPASLRG